MGGNNSKDELVSGYIEGQRTERLTKESNFPKSPNPKSQSNKAQDKFFSGSKQMNPIDKNSSMSVDNNNINNQQIEENNFMKPVKQLDNQTKLTLSKRQQNVLPQMTQRVLSQQSMILCKSPITQGYSPSQQEKMQTQTQVSMSTGGNPDQTGRHSFISNVPQQTGNNAEPESFKQYTEFSKQIPKSQQKVIQSSAKRGNDSYRNSIYGDFKKETSKSRLKKQHAETFSRQEFDNKLKNIRNSRRSSDSTTQNDFESFHANKLQHQISQQSASSGKNTHKQQVTDSSIKKSVKRIPYSSKPGFLPDSSQAHQIIADKKKKLLALKNNNLSNFHSPPLQSQRSSSIMKKSSQNDGKVVSTQQAFMRQSKAASNNVSTTSNNGGLSALMQYTEKIKSQNLVPPQQHKLRADKSASKLETREYQNLALPQHEPLTFRQTSTHINQVKHHNQESLYSYNQNTYLESEIKSQTIRNDIDNLSDNGSHMRTLDYPKFQKTIEYREFSFSSQIVNLILLFNMDEYPKYLRISAAWHCCINDSLDEYTNQLENTFIQKHMKYLHFLKSYNNATPIYFCSKRGIRLDRIFQCEILQVPQAINQTMKIAYDFQYIKKSSSESATNLKGSSNNSNRYHSEYRFDVIKKGQKRITWIHLGDDMPPYSQNEIQMQPGDVIEFAVCLFNMNGIIDINSLEWEYPEILSINQNERDPLTYNRDLKILQRKNDRKTKVHCNTNRICEVEDAVVEWINVGVQQRDQPKLAIDSKAFENRFKVMKVQFNELDLHFNKILLQTMRRGVVEQNIFGESIVVHVKAENERITNEVKKRGVMFDRNKGKERIQMRVGDLLVVYNSIKIPHEFQPDIMFPDSEFASKVSSAYNTNQNYNQTQSTSRGETSNNKSVKKINI